MDGSDSLEKLLHEQAKQLTNLSKQVRDLQTLGLIAATLMSIDREEAAAILVAFIHEGGLGGVPGKVPPLFESTGTDYLFENFLKILNDWQKPKIG